MSRFAQSWQIGIKQASEEYRSSSVTKSWATVTYAKQVTMRKGNFVHQRILLRWFSMFCVSMNAYKMIIFAHSKCKRYENRKIQGVALPKKERNGQEWKSSHHGTHHGEQDKKKGGRPPTGRVRKLSKSATVKFSKPSYEALRLRARKANRKLAEYIRESALNGEVVSGHNAETVAIAKSRIYAGRTTKLSPSRTDSTNGRTYPRPLEWYFFHRLVRSV